MINQKINYLQELKEVRKILSNQIQKNMIQHSQEELYKECLQIAGRLDVLIQKMEKEKGGEL